MKKESVSLLFNDGALNFSHPTAKRLIGRYGGTDNASVNNLSIAKAKATAMAWILVDAFERGISVNEFLRNILEADMRMENNMLSNVVDKKYR